ncbi:MAG: Cof-type HAD-IIB family hydrolase [Lachnospiraceae bacterium]|uniref:Cof-type HAD-IIB family hydrolase n=1 Tax=Candidatus Weimeria bifida TaxID=2599074 RepID=A0A6N7J029_9FIRM|nr:Cof-type HAD-IIB family hydrolase [Candidatus Weimeria bifida]RRF95041.1 MAG: Cof-type HAD-IIB family hydrolase [Lachnospiraceae bacterium]
MKAVFFDIDGTLWDTHNVIPESTVRAIHALQKNGNLAFINTGRSRSFVRRKNLLDIGFDGICSGCGTMLELNGRVEYYYKIPADFVAYTLETIRKYHFRPVLEGRYNLYLEKKDFAGDPYGEKLFRELGNNILSIDDNWGKWEISKMSCATPQPEADVEAVKKVLGNDYTFMSHNPEVCEMVPAGHNKATVIDLVCGKCGIDLSDTVSIGDGVNDLDMLRHAGVGVAMGSGADEAKNAADIVTSGLKEDGIERALKKLGLI